MNRYAKTLWQITFIFLFGTLCIVECSAGNSEEKIYNDLNVRLQKDTPSEREAVEADCDKFVKTLIKDSNIAIRFIYDKQIIYGRELLSYIIFQMVHKAKPDEVSAIIRKLSDAHDCELRANLGIIINGGYNEISERHRLIALSLLSMLKNEKFGSDVTAACFDFFFNLDSAHGGSGYRKIPEVAQWARKMAFGGDRRYLWYTNVMTMITDAPFDEELLRYVVQAFQNKRICPERFDGICVGLAARLRWPALHCPVFSREVANKLGKALIHCSNNAINAESPFSYYGIGPGYHYAHDLPLLLGLKCDKDIAKPLFDSFFANAPLGDVVWTISAYLSDEDRQKVELAAEYADKVFARCIDMSHSNTGNAIGTKMPLCVFRKFLNAYFASAKIPDKSKQANRQLLFKTMGLDSLGKE